MAWLGTWAKRKKITVDNTNIDSDLTHFSVPIVLGTSVGQSAQDLSEIFDDLGSNYLKIAITKVDGTTQIYGDIEQWDTGTEKAVIHVAKSDLDITTAAVTELYIYFDSAQADNTTYISLSGGVAAQSVWDSNYNRVYHFAQDPNGDAASSILDSTSNNNDMTPSGSMTSADLVDGLIGKAIEVDGVDDSMGAGPTTGPITNFTYEVFINPTNIGANEDFIGSQASSIAFRFASAADGTMQLVKANVALIGASTGALSTGTWQLAVVTYDSSGNWQFTIDGIDAGSGTNLQTFAATSYIIFGVSINPNFFNGKFGEGRISDIVRSLAWQKATTYGLNDDLLTYGLTETNPTAITNQPIITITT